jgi:hypothetical protein
MTPRTFVVVVALFSALTSGAFAQSAASAHPSSGEPPGNTSAAAGPALAADCAWHDQAQADHQRLAPRIERVQRELDARPLKGAAIALGISAALTVAGILTAALYKDSEYRSVPLLWIVPGVAGAGLIASGSALGVRLHQRRPFKVPRRELLRQKAQLHYQLQTFASEGCVDIATEQRDAAARVAEIGGGIVAMEARAKSVSLVGPRVLMGLGAAMFLSATITGIMLAVAVAAAADHSEPVDRTPMRVAFGAMPVGAALLVGGGVWLQRRRRERRRIMQKGSPLELEKRRLEMRLVPQVGPTSLGLSWSGHL